MENEIKDFIETWQDNIEKVNDFYGRTYNDLAKFCISSCRKAYKNFSLKRIIIELHTNRNLYKEKTSSFELLEKALHFLFHKETIKNKSLDRKYIYSDQTNQGEEIVFERNIEIFDNKIRVKKINQNKIDSAIVSQFIKKEKSTDSNDSYIYLSTKGKFIFYQIAIYQNSPLRIGKWVKILEQLTIDNINDLVLLKDIYNFFKKYNKLETEQERLGFWFIKLKENIEYRYFIKYFTKKKLKIFNENLISLFKGDYFQTLEDNFNINLKKSINKEDYLELKVKEFKGLLSKSSDGTISYRNHRNHRDVYEDLIKGNREDYYNKVYLLKFAGETEAIFDFIKYLEGYSFSSNKKKTENETNPLKLDLLPIEIFDNTRDYIKKNAHQVNICYKYKAYDACFILLRKIIETLIIEFYEKEGIEEKIKDSDGNYFMLKTLITSFQNENKFKKYNSRSINEILPRIKRNGDLSAHKRKFNARKSDVDRIRDDYRIVFEELIHSIYH